MPARVAASARSSRRGVLAEVGAGSRSHPHQVHAAAGAQVDLVQVGLEDRRLAVARLEQQRQHRLPRLAHHRALVRQPEVLDQLLGERAPPLAHLAAAQVDPGGAEDAGEGEAGVAEEARVLGGEHGVDQVLRQLVDDDWPPLHELGAVVRADQRRLEQHRLDLGAVERQPAHPGAAEARVEQAPAAPARRQREAPQVHGERSLRARVAADRRAPALDRPVARLLEVGDQAVDVDELADGEPRRRRVEPRRLLEGELVELAGEPPERPQDGEREDERQDPGDAGRDGEPAARPAGAGRSVGGVRLGHPRAPGGESTRPPAARGRRRMARLLLLAGGVE